MRLRWRGFRGKYGCDECGHREWQWPVRIIRPRLTSTIHPSSFIGERWVREARRAAEQYADMVDAKIGALPYGGTIHIQRPTMKANFIPDHPEPPFR